jgi:hypothetical protein
VCASLPRCWAHTGGAGTGRQGAPGVTEAVEAEAVRETSDGASPAPLPTQGGTPEGSALLTDEDQAIRPRKDDSAYARIGLVSPGPVCRSFAGSATHTRMTRLSRSTSRR